MKIFGLVCCALMGVNFLSNTGWADDYNPPPWRGDPNTTYQRWEFSDNNSTPSPNEVVNPLGDPNLTVAGDAPFTSWMASDMGHNGVWKFKDFIKVDIPNYDIPNPTKEIWIQITYASDSIEQGFWFRIDSIPPLTSFQLLHQEAVDMFYYHETYSLIIQPNPNFETIWIQPRNCTMFVDEIVIDTICSPNSPTLSLHTPNGGELLRSGSFSTVTWSSHGSISQVLIEYSTDNGQGWTPVDPPNTGNTGSYIWDPVPAADSNQCMIRISDLVNPDVNDTSDNSFTINPCRELIVGDFNNDCYINFKDMAIFAQFWLYCANSLDSNCDLE